MNNMTSWLIVVGKLSMCFGAIGAVLGILMLLSSGSTFPTGAFPMLAIGVSGVVSGLLLAAVGIIAEKLTAIEAHLRTR